MVAEIVHLNIKLSVNLSHCTKEGNWIDPRWEEGELCRRKSSERREAATGKNETITLPNGTMHPLYILVYISSQQLCLWICMRAKEQKKRRWKTVAGWGCIVLIGGRHTFIYSTVASRYYICIYTDPPRCNHFLSLPISRKGIEVNEQRAKWNPEEEHFSQIKDNIPPSCERVKAFKGN